MPRSETAIRNGKRPEKTKKMFDGSGLYLELTPTSGKWWRLKYRIGKREKRLSLGVYPDVPLNMARERCQRKRTQLADGIDPSEIKKAKKQAQAGAESFEVITRNVAFSI